ncbi:MAG: sensor histidine kinase [Flavobacteriaceae bacterium]
MEHLDNSLTGKNHKSLYWTCQLVGWGIVSTYWAYVVYSRDDYGGFYTFLNYLCDISIGVLLTHLYRTFALKMGWNELPIQKLVLRVIPVIILLAVLYTLISNVKWYFFYGGIVDPQVDFYAAITYWDPIFITGLRLMSIWLLAYHLYHYYQKEVVTARENAHLSLLIARSQMDNLSAQLNPHFLFNSLNSIKSLVEEDPKKARRAIDLLSDLLRSSLYEKDQDLCSIKQELSLVKDYVELEKLRFEERLNFEVDIDSELEQIKVPTLSIQLLVENAIKHGIDKLIRGGNVVLSITRQGDFLQIMVRNPGTLELNNPGVGLKNLQERIKIQYKSSASFVLEMPEEHLVQAILTLPIQDHETL